MTRPKTPSSVARALRQEAGFGCAACGCPITDYHHIVEWKEKQHFDPEHMVALCPNHHREYAKRDKKFAYRLKQNPINIRTGKFRGYLAGISTSGLVRVGSMQVESIENILEYAGNSILSCKVTDGEAKISAYIPDSKFFPEVEISHNSISAQIKDFWDIEFKTNWVKFRRNLGDIFLEIDLRGDQLKVYGKLSIFDENYTFFENENNLAGNKMIGGLFKGNGGKGTALAIGPRGRILKPNYAMRRPSAIYLPEGRIWDPRRIP